MSVSFLYRPIVFQEPERAVHPPSWLDYTPFAFWIVDALRPHTFVELGCQSGNSYSSFAQAVQTLGLSTLCYGVDTWRGDSQAGFFDETVFQEWAAYHDRRFSTFSRLIRATFDEALEHFSDGSIDLLHLDGCHTFEAASHDFEMWRAKMSEKGLVLCHDIDVREKDFGAWRLWERLRDQYPSFEFRHGHGLGVVGLGHAFPEAVRWLLSLRSDSPEQTNTVRLFFARLGAAVLSRYTVAETQRTLRSELAARDQRLAATAAETDEVRTDLAESQRSLATIQVAFSEAKDARASVDAALADRTAEAERLTLGLTALQQQVNELSSVAVDLASRTTEVERLSSELTTLQKRIGELASEVENKDKRLADEAQERVRVTVELENRDQRLRDEAQERARLTVELEKRNQRLAHEVRERDRLTAELANSEQCLKAAEADIERLHETRRTHTDRALGTRLNDTPRVELCVSSLAPKRHDPATIVVVSHVAPWRPRAGNEYRVRRMLKSYRARGYRIVLVVAPLPGEEIPREGIEAIGAAFGNIIQVHRDGRIEYILRELSDVVASLNGTLAESFAGLLGEDSGTSARERELVRIDRTFCHDAVIATVLHLERSLGPHVLQVEYIWMTRLLPLVRGEVLKVIDTIDVFSSIQEKVRAFGLRDVAIEPDEEAARLSRADLLLAIQDDERVALRRLAPSLPVVTVGVDFDVVADQRPPTDGRILIVASSNPRNCKGVSDFLRFAWPRIHGRFPQTELVVVGTVATVLPDGELSGVRVVGPVDDLAAQYRDAAVVINPVVAGTGLKIKTLEALSHLRPVVTWPAGVDGLDPKLGALCRVARDWYEFSEQVIAALMKTPNGGLTAEDRAVIATRLDPDQVYASLHSTYRAFFGRTEPVKQPRERAKRGSLRAETAHV